MIFLNLLAGMFLFAFRERPVIHTRKRYNRMANKHRPLKGI